MGLIVGIGSCERLPVGTVVMWTFGYAEVNRIDDSRMGLTVGSGIFKRRLVSTGAVVTWMGLIVGMGIFKRLPVGTVVRLTFGGAEETRVSGSWMGLAVSMSGLGDIRCEIFSDSGWVKLDQ